MASDLYLKDMRSARDELERMLARDPDLGEEERALAHRGAAGASTGATLRPNGVERPWRQDHLDTGQAR